MNEAVDPSSRVVPVYKELQATATKRARRSYGGKEEGVCVTGVDAKWYRNGVPWVECEVNAPLETQMRGRHEPPFFPRECARSILDLRLRNRWKIARVVR